MSYPSEFVKNYVERGILEKFGQEGLKELRKLEKLEAEQEAKAKLEAEKELEAKAQKEAEKWAKRHKRILELKAKIKAKKRINLLAA